MNFDAYAALAKFEFQGSPLATFASIATKRNLAAGQEANTQPKQEVCRNVANVATVQGQKPENAEADPQSGHNQLCWPGARISMLLYSSSWRSARSLEPVAFGASLSYGGASRRLGGFDAPGDCAVLEFPPISRHYLLQ